MWVCTISESLIGTIAAEKEKSKQNSVSGVISHGEKKLKVN